MKLFLIASMVLGGGSAVALTNEEIREDVKGVIEERVQHRMDARKEDRLNELRENGIAYPSEEKVIDLTEEQLNAVYALIDEYNAANDFSLMTDEEIFEAMELFHTELKELAETLGFELPERPSKEEIRGMIRDNVKDHMRERFEEKRAEFLEELKTNGFSLPNEERLYENLTEEQVLAIETKIAEVNETYDWANMTDEEIKDALLEAKQELRVLFDELEIVLPSEDFQRGYRRGHRHGYHHGYQDGLNQSPDENLPEVDENQDSL